jgi:hypothetical protein
MVKRGGSVRTEVLTLSKVDLFIHSDYPHSFLDSGSTCKYGPFLAAFVKPYLTVSAVAVPAEFSH